MRPQPGSRHELDSTVVEIELTLTSIIQGVALYFLTENAHIALSVKQLTAWLYVAAGLLVILIFWSRSILHTLTLIRWPLELVHNFIYIACTLGEAILFTRLGSPRAWFALSLAYTLGVWTLFVVDLRMIAARCRDSTGQAGSQLCAIVRRDQLLNIYALVPALFLFNLASSLAIWRWPHFFLVRGGHVYLIGLSVVTLAGYLLYVVAFYRRIAPLVVAVRSEWYADS